MQDATGSTERPRRLLVLDDEEMIGLTIVDIAIKEGLESQTTTNADDFMACVQDWDPDVIVLDLLLPGTDGIDIINILAGKASRAQLIVTSGLGAKILNSACDAAMEHGLDVLGSLPKPFMPSDLRELLGRMMVTGDNRHVGGGQYFSPDREDLQAALSQKQLFVVYQPKVKCKSGLLAGFEALVRWQHPKHGVIPPDKFIKLAEDYNLIDQLTLIVVEEALAWFSTRLTSYQPRLSDLSPEADLCLSFNISAKSLPNTDVFDWVYFRCQALGIHPHRLIFELTESSTMHDSPTAYDNLTRLRMRGFKLSIDDFGTGYSSMVQLVKLPFSEMKVDKSFVLAAMKSKESKAIVGAIINLGHSLNMSTTAEGIEDQFTLDYLSSLDCDQAQGYYIARPMRADDVDNWFQQRELQREIARVQALKDIGMLDTDPESRFDVITQLAKKLLKASVSFISLIDENRQWFKSVNGISFTETPRDESFCSLAIQSDGLFIVEDALEIPLLADNPLVIREPGIRSYAGIPLIIDGGHAVGALCVCDTAPRCYSEREKQILEELARLAQRELRVRVDNPSLLPSSLVDGLSKQEFRSLAETIWLVSQHLNLRFSTISLKIDGLELINERFGRSQGDSCLKSMTALINSFAQQADLTGRARNTLLSIHMIDSDDEQIEDVARQLQIKLDDWISQNAVLAECLKPSHGVYSCQPQDHANLASVIEHAISGLDRHDTLVNMPGAN